jgi:hypothetical protein
MSKELDRFLSKIDICGVDDCWNWIGGINDYHYGVFYVNRRPHYAHRYSWKLYRGEIPTRMCILHHCDNRLCVNPNHLFMGNRIDNINDMMNKNRQAKGERHPAAKLNRNDVVYIREQYTNHNKKQCELAIELGMSHQEISEIVNGNRWKGI